MRNSFSQILKPMNDNQRVSLLQKLVADQDLKRELNIRKRTTLLQSVKKSQLDDFIKEGWEIDKEFKTTYRFTKPKKHDAAFEDQVWCLIANLGFKLMNEGRGFHVPYDSEGNSQQVDVFAKDDETILIVECKSAERNKRGDFKKDLEAFKVKIGGIRKTVQNLFPSTKLKFKFIFATKNYTLDQVDRDRLANIGGTHFDDEVIEYYTEMFKQIGLAAKYQLLGSLFEGMEIPELDISIPAIQGKMGNHVYYSFSIEPEKLLKIGYVLHRNKANKKMMPTYQRLIKRSRLKSVQEFIDNKGYFANSIIISIDTRNKKLSFDRANTQVKSAISSLGVLHLPKKYRSAFIIDGQHRLYGYANSEYRFNNSIPVVAFIDLAREEQVKLFSQINENQKAVSKNLRNTLRADLLWTSDSLIDQLNALKSRISMELGENMDSALYDRIIIGENNKTKTRCVTTEAIIRALRKTNFLGKVTKTRIDEMGTFYRGNLDESFNKLSNYLIRCFNYLSKNIEEEWKRGEDDVIVINKAVYSQILIFSDIVDLLFRERICNPQSTSKVLFEEAKTYIDPIIYFYSELKDELKDELRSSYGSGGDTKYWRKLQLCIREDLQQFNPDGLDDYIKQEAREYNTEAFKLIRDIETFFKEDFRVKLEDKFGNTWFKKGVPPQIAKKAIDLAYDKNLSIENEEDEVKPWDCMTIIAYRAIALKSWRDVFESHYTRPNEAKINGGKDAKTEWMVKLEKLRNENFHQYSVTEDEFDFIQALRGWLISDQKGSN